MESAGWTVYGTKMKGKGRFAGVEGDWKWSVIAVLRGEPQEVLFMDGKTYVFRPRGPT